MKVVLLAAGSGDGFFCRANGSTDWVEDESFLEKVAAEFSCVAMGHKTYKEYGEPAFEGVQHIVLSHEMSGDSRYKNVHFVGGPAEAVKKAKALSFKKLLVVGGGQCNGAFAAAKLLDAIWLDEHPVRLGKGIKLF